MRIRFSELVCIVICIIVISFFSAAGLCSIYTVLFIRDVSFFFFFFDICFFSRVCDGKLGANLCVKFYF